jgi:hypothetical protein
MIRAQQSVLDRLPEKSNSPALRQIRELAMDRATESGGRGAVVVGPASELLSTWSIRLWNATLQARRIVGLADFVRSLMSLSPDEKVEQIALTNGPKTGLVFFLANTHEPIGAIISVSTEADIKRSQRNWQDAIGQAPFLAVKSSGH